VKGTPIRDEISTITDIVDSNFVSCTPTKLIDPVAGLGAEITVKASLSTLLSKTKTLDMECS